MSNVTEICERVWLNANDKTHARAATIVGYQHHLDVHFSNEVSTFATLTYERPISSKNFLLEESTHRVYLYRGGKTSCDCDYSTRSGKTCKHGCAVAMILLRDAGIPLPTPQLLTCDFCFNAHSDLIEIDGLSACRECRGA